ncbi:hypothetical protein [Microbacterium sp. JZ31]|uniref:hypothetical protein n=1 Tax=Microbacterium sp. JZ31 TaxID=1906274 RepID=UPI001932F293|nr:hypothetical protein [Microbacterium sp. JZ31]
MTEVADARVVSRTTATVTELLAPLPLVGTLLDRTGVQDDLLAPVAGGLDDVVADVVDGVRLTDPVLPLPPIDVDDLPEIITPPGAIAPPAVSAPPALGVPPAVIAPGGSAPAVPVDRARATAAEHSAPATARMPDAVTRGGETSSASQLRLVATLDSGTLPLSPAVQAAPSGFVPESDSSSGDAYGSGPLGMVPGSTSCTGSSGGLAAPTAVLGFPRRTPAPGFTTFRTHSDDALPGAPVFGTDVSPD